MNILCEIICEYVDYYLDEYIEEMQARTGKHISVPTLWRSLAYCGITRKKLQKAATERNELLRNAFIASIGHYRIEQLVFMDESLKDECTLTYLYSYSDINSRAVKKVVFVRGKRYTLLPALTEQGIIAVDIMEGSCTKQRFKEFVISQVVSICYYIISIYTNSVLVLDNAKIHHDQDLLDYLSAFGIKVEFLPPYSPDFNPIETAFSMIK
ncbi:hypothetical protein GLOIN_2v1776603 [Rhizophagus clarus]|uniref:Tc1-like transposase DDE domain-containing protein n=1 Tax=Rhizophagus clarus TaxID=94130 RepID=A0A8H3L2U4_9GLOM|nr:hypothetical protein GLOIN_2v1776603 [Rhizophagus clarus]